VVQELGCLEEFGPIVGLVAYGISWCVEAGLLEGCRMVCMHVEGLEVIGCLSFQSGTCNTDAFSHSSLI
jgi:hypothetical protein